MLLFCLQQLPPLMEYIYVADNRRWLSLFLRWRLVSRKYNEMILQRDLTHDQFNREMFKLLCDLTPLRSYKSDKHMQNWPENGFFNLDGRRTTFMILQASEPLTSWDSFAKHNRPWRVTCRRIGFERTKLEYRQWMQVIPRERRELMKRPPEMHPNVFISAIRFRMPMTRNAYTPVRPKRSGSRCSLCFRTTRAKWGPYGDPYICEPCKDMEMHFHKNGAEFSARLLPNSKKRRL
jgi:hypothetical protein